MGKFRFPSDRQINSTETNDYAEGTRDENLWQEDLVDTQIAQDDFIPDMVDETGIEQSPVYNESGYKYPDHL